MREENQCVCGGEGGRKERGLTGNLVFTVLLYCCATNVRTI